MSTQTNSPSRLGLLVAFAIVYVVWGSTYLANIVAIETIPPFVLIAARLGLAGVVLLGLSRFRETWTLPTRREWRNMAGTSFLFLTVGLGAVVWAEQYIESGTTALLVAAEPLLVVLVLWMFDRKRPRWQAFAGIALGILGTIVLVGQDIVIEGDGALLGIAAIAIGILAWAFGSVLTSRLKLPSNRMQTAGWQMLIGGALAIPVVLVTGDYTGFNLGDVSVRSAWAFGFLVVFGSIIAYSAFLYLLQHVSPEKVATSTYVHPVVAVTLGVLFRDEVLTGQTVIASVILLAGVFFVNGNWGRRKDSALVQPRQANNSAIVRTWRGQALPGRERELEDFIERVVLPDMRAAKGNLTAEIARANHESLTITSQWADAEAEQAYVAGDVSRPKAYTGEEDLLDTRTEAIERE